MVKPRSSSPSWRRRVNRMATINLSHYNKEYLPDAQTMRIGIVVSEWNDHITSNLLKGCLEAFTDCGIPDKNIFVAHVPGSFELALGAKMLFDTHRIEAVICLGCVIREKLLTSILYATHAPTECNNLHSTSASLSSSVCSPTIRKNSPSHAVAEVREIKELKPLWQP